MGSTETNGNGPGAEDDRGERGSGEPEAVDRSVDRSQPVEKLHPNESIKAGSGFLRGNVQEGLRDPITGAIPGDATQLTKFHGIYQQDDRDLREERRRKKLEPAYEFMIRVRLPGGVCTPEQWLTLDDLARTRANGTLRLTTRQTFQFHGVLKRNLKPVLQGLHEQLLDTLGACGDVNRGVMATPLPELGKVHEELFQVSKAVSDHLIPRSRAYHEIWLDGEPLYRGPRQDPTDDSNDQVTEEEEPIYGTTYLPRKFKIGFAVPPTNDVDVFTQDLGFIAITEGDRLAGLNVVVGGGMGRTDNEPDTYPRLGDVIGFCPPDRAVEVAEKVVTIQRDYGNRVERKLARMKYTIDRLGLEWFREELHRRLGWSLEEARPYRFETSQDRFGWSRNGDGTLNYTAFIENGRVKDEAGEATNGAEPGPRIMTGLREIARLDVGDFRVTPNQNLILARIPEERAGDVEELLEGYGIAEVTERTQVRRHSMACVGLPTCPLSMAESERYFPELITKVEGLMEEVGLGDRPIVIRMSGCNNGCSRPYVAEVGFSGRAPGKYNMYLGGGFHGERLNRPVLENVDEATILEHLRHLFQAYAQEGEDGEAFGDFAVRAGHVAPVHAGPQFNE